VANPAASLSRGITSLGRSIVSLIRRVRRPVTLAICRFLIRLGINQTHITLTRMFLLIGVYFAWVYTDLGVALAVMLIAWSMDCIDGDLSRLLGNDNAVGEFEDVFGDNLVFLIFPLALASTGLLSGELATIAVFAAYAVLWLAVRQQSPDSVTLVFHPKGDLVVTFTRKAVWVLMYLYIFFRIDFFTASYAAITAAHLLSVVVNYFQIIRPRLRPAAKRRPEKP
jgi:phosphatidylglycerophosphate synthase